MESETPTTHAAFRAYRLLPVAEDMETRLRVIFASAAAVNDDWLKKQPEGIRGIINKIREQSNI